MEMFRPPLITTFAFIITAQATPIQLCKNLQHRDGTIDTKTGAHQLSTEAIIGVIGVVVALLGIASSLAWSKRRKSRSRFHRTLEGIQIARFHHFEIAKLIRFARIDTLQLSNAWRCFHAIIPNRNMDAHSWQWQTELIARIQLSCTP
jgi:hypothetical protein